MSRHHFLHYYWSKKRRITVLDRVVMVSSFIYPLMGIPQAVEVMNGNVEGVSLTAWAGFMAFELLFMVYGIVHRIKPMLVINLLWLIVDGAIVIGIVVNR